MTRIIEKISVIDLKVIGSIATAPATAYERPNTEQRWEIAWIRNGHAAVTSNGDTHSLPPNAVIVTKPGLQAAYSWDSRNITRVGYVLFTSESLIEHDWPLVRHLAADDVVLALLNHLLWLDATRTPGWRDQARDALGYALTAYLSGASGTSSLSDRPLPPPIERSMALVRVRWAQGGPLRTPSLDELAGAAAVTREHLCRVYTKEIGYGPIEALRLLRLRYSAALLERTDLSVGKISALGGFTSQFHFSRVFKDTFGISPSRYRNSDLPRAPLPDQVQRLGMYV
ncbi:helix-turn-helix transcriptional regulator [Arthrobacter sp. HMWF013]|uniref:helix-turn-helix transcriptional regulator n=1 Tax=Arthrobacter sp. HMWF013 TaxID=2056849 RepID=UPI0015E81AF4|nr:helix-turn-helix transcriptional regulator [Arthrobacter sp. HMWF013]